MFTFMRFTASLLIMLWFMLLNDFVRVLPEPYMVYGETLTRYK